jgi:hypothetical protein
VRVFNQIFLWPIPLFLLFQHTNNAY